MKVKTSYVPNDSKFYLTVDKEYEVFEKIDNETGWIIDDVDDDICIRYQSCGHLNFKTWEIVE